MARGRGKPEAAAELSSGPGSRIEQVGQVVPGRKPPRNLEAEQAVLGGLLLSGEALSDMRLQPEDFWSPAHRAVFETIRDMNDARKPVDLLTVAEELERTGRLGMAGGHSYLAELAEGVVSAANAPYFAEIVHEARRQRDVINIGLEMVDAGYGVTISDVEELLPKAQALLDKAVAFDAPLAQLESLTPQTAQIYFDKLRERSALGGAKLRAPWKSYNDLTYGLWPTETIVIAGRPSTGKTAMGLNFFTHAAGQGAKCGYMSLEMPWDALLSRIVSSTKGIPGGRLRSGKLSDAQWSAVMEGMDEVQSWKMRWFDRPPLTPRGLRALARRWDRELQGLDLLVVDYLQLVAPDVRGQTREQEIAEISRTIKLVAGEFGTSVVVLAQLNRDVEKRAGKVPMLSDLRESGALENDADTVVMIYPWDVNTSVDCPFVDIAIAKARNGSTGKITLPLVRPLTRFINELDLQNGVVRIVQ